MAIVNLLKTRKEKLGIDEPDKSINKKKQLDNSFQSMHSLPRPN